MLIIHDNNCYFAEFPEDTERVQLGGNSVHTEEALIAVIEHGHGGVPHGPDLAVHSSNLSYVRSKYQDILADFHSCKDGWTHFQGSCYVILSEIVPWTSAKIMCEALGGGLLEIHSKPENDFITQLARHNGTRYVWLGLTDLAYERKWVWISSGQAPDYKNWISGAPNNLHSHEGGEDCAFLHVPDSGRWGDYYCDLYRDNDPYHIAAACEAK
ncbi:hypothetical protein BaRGS_00005750 [Batillaria attramentaria]|uniref:C-type lectin domain-containing protein n=1 Tax=Batillaria attramentaria TaxID=370345 RepID=A0ABD0LVS1_9CAEN